MAKIANLAQVATSTVGTGTVTLGAPITGALSFAAAGVQDGDIVSYAIQDGGNSEVGRGVFNLAASTLTREILKSTNSDDPIVLSGNAVVMVTRLAEDHITENKALGNVTGATSINLQEANIFNATVTGSVTWTFTAADVSDGFVIHLTNGGAFAQIWPASVDWPRGNAPILTPSGLDVLVFVTTNGGTTWRGALAMKDSK